MTGAAGRPAIGPRVSVRFPPDLLARVDAEAARAGESRASVVRRLVGALLGHADDGVDVAQIRQALALSPGARIEAVARAVQNVSAIRGRAVR